MFEAVSGLPDQGKLEREVLALWQERGIFEKLRARNRGGARFSFLDGPITANNPMGVHHAWGRTLKDIVQRYWAMLGRDQRYQNGFDCQGLWVEVEVERELGFTSKRDIERYGVAEFVNQCRARTARFSETITQESIRLGCWMDWEHSYRTDAEENNYAIWRFLKRCHERGLIYRGRDVMPWCPRCGTGLSQQEVQEGYREVSHPGLTLRLPIKSRAREYLLVWTTTPWTLTANVACAVHPELAYARVRQGQDVYYLAANRTSAVLAAQPEWQIESQLPGKDLVGLTYIGPFDDLPQEREAAGAHRVLAWREVAEEEGTGVVHMAPGCGKEDYDVCQEQGLPIVAPIDENGVLLPGAGPLAGRFASEAASDIVIELRRRHLLYRVDDYRHRYPHCWRCGTELLFRLVDEWFIAMNPWREEIMHLAEQVAWVPEYGREVELDWLRNMRDWMISKKRYWGLALPIWQCACGWFDVIGSREELVARAVQGQEQFAGHSPHRPWVDVVKVRCESCGGLASRIPEVGNPWLDAGIVPYSTLGYFQDRGAWERWFPADLVIESLPGQFRNWFYVLLAMSAMMTGRPPVRTIMGYSTVVDEQGEEMHKSKGNAIWFAEAAEVMGADLVRWISASHPLTQPLRFGWGRAGEVRFWLRTLWNVYGFLAMYANADGWPATTDDAPRNPQAPLDRWLRVRLALTAQEVSAALEAFNPPRATAALLAALDDLSNWWVRRSRRRFWRGGADVDKEAAYCTLHTALVDLCRLLAPFVPFTAEALYQRIAHPLGPALPESVHLCRFPASAVGEEGLALVDECVRARAAVSAGRAARESARIRVRQPLASALVLAPDGTSPFPSFEQDVMEELNVKRLVFVATRKELGGTVAEIGGMTVGFDTSLTAELIWEGIARDLVRQVQNLRKRAALRVDQRIMLWISTPSEGDLPRALDAYGDYVAAETLAIELHRGMPPAQTVRQDSTIAGQRAVMGVRGH